MILLCCGQIQRKHFEATLLFAQQLEHMGHRVAIDARFVPDRVTKQIKYEMAPFLLDDEDSVPHCVIVLGAETIAENVQIILGQMRLTQDVPVWALGTFPDLQSQINATNRIAFAIGYEPQLLDLSAHGKPVLHGDAITPFVTQIHEEPKQSAEDACRILIYVPGEDLSSKSALLSQIIAIGRTPTVTLHIITNAKGKDAVQKSHQMGVSVFGYAELPPLDLLNYFDVLVFTGAKIQGERMVALALYAMGAGKVVVDSTKSAGLSGSGAPVLSGPVEVSGLQWYVQETLLRNRLEIGLRTQQNAWLKQFDYAELEQAIDLKPQVQAVVDHPAQTVFFPTNGNGMGHAQRCALVAEAMNPDATRMFAAFPSCVDMLHKRGFSCLPMVSRSRDHGVDFAADILNFLRLRALIKKGDHLVFDGGYVFDSVYRLISRLGLPATWIRRGLWRAGQINTVALERERAFSKVIVPTEAFPELNASYSEGNRVSEVGPIVRQTKQTEKKRASLRSQLSDNFGQQVETLVITMLGGGVASERTVQMQFLCSLFERRENCLHLMVAWPNAVVSNSLFGWNNSHVIHTAHTIDLCQASDLCISAAGYNSFHELLYGKVPTIFIPQSAPYLDDQERRAQSAFERDLSGLVDPLDLLTLEREVSAFLDGGKAIQVRDALREVVLPDPGNAAAAALIAEETQR